MSAQDNLNPKQFFHGTKTKFEPGLDMIYPGYARASGARGSPRPHAYMTEDLEMAKGYAERARGTGSPHVYTVEPLGSYEPDPDLNQMAPAYRSRDALRVTGEID